MCTTMPQVSSLPRNKSGINFSGLWKSKQCCPSLLCLLLLPWNGDFVWHSESINMYSSQVLTPVENTGTTEVCVIYYFNMSSKDVVNRLVFTNLLSYDRNTSMSHQILMWWGFICKKQHVDSFVSKKSKHWLFLIFCVE